MAVNVNDVTIKIYTPEKKLVGFATGHGEMAVARLAQQAQVDEQMAEFSRRLLANSSLPETAYIVLPAPNFQPAHMVWWRAMRRHNSRFARGKKTRRVRTPGGRIEHRH